MPVRTLVAQQQYPVGTQSGQFTVPNNITSATLDITVVGTPIQVTDPTDGSTYTVFSLNGGELRLSATLNGQPFFTAQFDSAGGGEYIFRQPGLGGGAVAVQATISGAPVTWGATVSF